MTDTNVHNSGEPRGMKRMVQIYLSLAGAELITRAIMFIAALIVIRSLSPASFGDFAYAVAYASVANFIIDFGLTTMVTRDVSADPDRAAEHLGSFLKTQLMLATLTLLLASLVALSGVVEGPSTFITIELCLGAVVIGSLGRPFEAVLTGRGKAQYVTVARIIRGVMLVVATTAAAVVNPKPETFALALLFSEAMGVVAIALISLIRVVRPKFSAGFADMYRLAKLAVPFALLATFNVLYLRIDILMLGQLDTAVSVGNYGVASRILETVMIIPVLFGTAFLATVSQTGPRTERARVQTAAAVRHVLLLSLPLVLILPLAAKTFIDIVAGSSYGDAVDILILLSPMVALTAAFTVLAALQIALNRLSILVKISLIGLAVKVALNLFAIPKYGAQGAAVTAVIAEAVFVVAQWYAARHFADIRSMLKSIVLIVICAVAMLAVTLSLLVFIPWYLALTVGISTFISIAILLRCITSEEIKLVASSIGVKFS